MVSWNLNLARSRPVVVQVSKACQAYDCRCRVLYLAEGPGSARMQVGLTPEHRAQLQGHTLQTWQALQQQRRHARDTSRFIGVCQAENGRWRMQVGVSKGRVRLTCQTEEEAAAAYDMVVLQDKGRCEHAFATVENASVLYLTLLENDCVVSFVHRLALPVIMQWHINCMCQPVWPTMQMQGQILQPASIPRKMPSLAKQVISYTFCCAGGRKPI